MNLKPAFQQIPAHKSLFNIGATLDIPTGYWAKGIYGENILLGGLGPLTGMVGPGNMYKSTIVHFMMLSAMAKIWASKQKEQTNCSTYDSEANIHISRLKAFVESHPEFEGVDIVDAGNWIVSDTSQYYANEWYAIARAYMKDKHKNAKQFQVNLPFADKDGKRLTETIATFSELDSLSEMRVEAGEDIMDKNEIGSSGGSHVFMREGLAKAQMLHECVSLGSAAHHYILSTAHQGDRNTMSAGPSNIPPKKQLQHLSVDTKIKAVPPQFLYSQHNLWQATNCALLWNKDDKTPKYPKRQGEAIPGDMDLNVVSLKHLRGKAGPSGFTLEIIVSQSEGVLPSLTEFAMLKDFGDFAFQGNDRTYQLYFMPEENLTRTTVRQKLDESPRLRRAMNITAELCQMHSYHRSYFDVPGKAKLMTPQELVKALTDRGYDINLILDNTRGWWTYDNEKVGLYFLSTKDLLEMAQDMYHPYWLDKDKKTIKKEFLRKS